MDLVINTPRFPKLGETVSGSSFMINPGGKGANQAVATQKFKCKTYMVGVVGNPFGDELIQSLISNGVDTSFVNKVNDQSSGVALITLAEHDNTIVLDAGANQLVSQEMIDQALMCAKPNDYVLMQNEIEPQIVSYTLKKSKELSLITILNPAPARVMDSEDFKYIDYLILNETEAEFYTGIEIIEASDVKQTCKKLKQLGVSNIILTLGSHGAVYYGEEITKVDAYTVDVVDTTAAGDTFIGALVSALSKKEPIADALNFASAAAALTITKKGAQQAIPSYDEVISFMSSRKP